MLFHTENQLLSIPAAVLTHPLRVLEWPQVLVTEVLPSSGHIRVTPTTVMSPESNRNLHHELHLTHSDMLERLAIADPKA